MELVKKHIITFVIGALIVVWTFVKDAFVTGADVKFQEKIMLIIKNEQSTKHIKSIALKCIDDEMNDPFALIDILSSEHVNKFAESKAVEVKEAVKKEILKNDSIKGDMIHELGVGTGIRNDEVMKELVKLLKAFKEGKLYSSRTVRGNF
jgi:hypothetical protein